MWTMVLGLVITYLCLWLVPFWLVWPMGVLFSLYLVTIIQKKRHSALDDEQILGILVGSWLALCYGLWLFLIR